jgi:hypothetical protein
MTMARKNVSSGREDDLLRIACFIIFNAIMFHVVLSNNDRRVAPLPSAPPKEGLKRFLLSQWQTILKINFEHIFHLALEILEQFPDAPQTEEILESLASTARRSVSSGIVLRHDFAGRSYHNLLLRTTGHYYATYYTSVPAAAFLSTLIFSTPNTKWSFDDLRKLSSFRVLDPACGSGTLISAAYTSLKDAYLKAAMNPNLDKFHLAALSQILHGWDVLDFAAHLTLSSLALHSPSAVTASANIYVLPDGVDKDGIALGSLSYLDNDVTLFGKSLARPVLKASMKGKSGGANVDVRPFDVIMMNPPYSRSAKPNLTFGYDEDRAKMQRALGALGRKTGLTGVGRAGLGPYFMRLAASLLKPFGRIGLVLPRSMLSGVSWEKVRAEIQADFQILYIVSNFDAVGSGRALDGWNWSENTALGEVLIVAEKTPPKNDTKVTYINISKKPKNEIEGLMIGQQAILRSKRLSVSLLRSVSSDLEFDRNQVGVVYQVPQQLLDGNWQAPATFFHPDLNRMALSLLTRQDSCKFETLCKSVQGKVGIGPDIAQVKTNFAHANQANLFPLVLGHQKEMNSLKLTQSSVTYGTPKKNNAANLHSRFASRLLLAERPHFTTEALLAMISPEKVLATAFWEITASSNLTEDYILLFMNSTYGIILFMSQSTSSMGDIFKLKKDQLANLKLPSPTNLSATDLSSLRSQIFETPFLPFSQEFLRAAQKEGPRYAIDSYFANTLKLDPLTPGFYNLLAIDPVLVKRSKSA